MRKYVIWVSENDVKAYIKVNSDGSTEAVVDKMSASALPNRAVAQAVVSAIKPAIKKQNFDVTIGIDIL